MSLGDAMKTPNNKYFFVMNEYTDPKVRSGRNQGGCLILFIALIIIVGLAMWFLLWGRAMPKTEEPALPSAEGKSVTTLYEPAVFLYPRLSV
jgi:cytoskeletal protein RodZ